MVAGVWEKGVGRPVRALALKAWATASASQPDCWYGLPGETKDRRSRQTGQLGGGTKKGKRVEGKLTPAADLRGGTDELRSRVAAMFR